MIEGDRTGAGPLMTEPIGRRQRGGNEGRVARQAMSGFGRLGDGTGNGSVSAADAPAAVVDETRSRALSGAKAGDDGLLRSVGNALTLLSAFSVQRPAWTLSQLVRELGLGKSTTFRLLATLEGHGFVRRDAETGLYGATIKLWEIGCAALAGTQLRDVAPHYLAGLVAATGETAYCAVLHGRDVVHVDVHVANNPIRLHADVGDRFAAHTVAMGKVLLAELPDDELERYIAGGLPGQTDRTITEAEAFRAELAAVRRLGYATNRGEWQDQVRGAAAPVRDRTGRAAAAIAVAGPSLRLTEDLSVLGELVRQTAARMSAAMGAPGPGGNALERRERP